MFIELFDFFVNLGALSYGAKLSKDTYYNQYTGKIESKAPKKKRDSKAIKEWWESLTDEQKQQFLDL